MGSEEKLDNAHLMRMAGRFSRRVPGFARAHGIPVIDCRRGERKHEIAEEYLATHTVKRGLFMILVARAIAPVWDVQHWSSGAVRLAKKMLRAHLVDGASVISAASQHGYSRAAFYLVAEAFESEGMQGLLDEKRGRRGPLKVTPLKQRCWFKCKG
jgi:hypothetical protein